MVIAFSLFFLAASAIFVGCLLPAHWLPPIKHDKWLHFYAFLTLSVFARILTHSVSELIFWLIGIFSAGLLIEILQHWVPGRNFCWRDMAANTAGISLVAVTLFF
jgi:VanZ family protein